MAGVFYSLFSKAENKKKSPNNKSIMPKAVATWLIDNTSLTFSQIAAFCDLHYLEVKLIADGENGVDIQGCNSVEIGYITEEEIKGCKDDPSKTPQLNRTRYNHASESKSYRTSVKKNSRKIKKNSDKPDAILWLIKHYPKISDKQIIKLIKTTEGTVVSIRNETHWKMSSLRPRDPVLLRLCTQDQLDSVEQDIEIEQKKS